MRRRDAIEKKEASARNVVDYAGSGKTGYNKIGMNPHMPQPNEKDMY